MRARWVAAALAVGAVLLGAACGLESGGVGGDPDGAVDVMNPIDGNGGDSGTPDGSSDGPSDAMDFDIPDLGTGETESGVPCACVPPIPVGYTVVAYAPSTRPVCPTGYGKQQDRVENPTAAASTCSCMCTATPSQQPTCPCGASPANFDLVFDKTNACAATPTTASAALAPGCTGGSTTYASAGNGLDWVKATPTVACAATGGTCPNPTKVQTIPAPSASQGRSCELTDALGTCNNGVCVPVPTVGYSVCVTKGTLDPCPMDFPIGHLTGTAIDDTRTCGPDACTCTIGGATCGVPQLSFWGSGGCNNNFMNTIPADGTCQNVMWGNAATTGSTRYSVQVNGATCSFKGSFTPQGTLGVKGGARVCCR